MAKGTIELGKRVAEHKKKIGEFEVTMKKSNSRIANLSTRIIKVEELAKDIVAIGN